MKILKYILLSVIMLTLSAFALVGCASGDNKDKDPDDGGNTQTSKPDEDSGTQTPNPDDGEIELPFIPA